MRCEFREVIGMTQILGRYRRKWLWCVSARGLQPMCMEVGFKPVGSLSRMLRSAVQVMGSQVLEIFTKELDHEKSSVVGLIFKD